MSWIAQERKLNRFAGVSAAEPDEIVLSEVEGAQPRDLWCPETESNRHAPFGARDFKSRASASFAIRARLRRM